MLFAFSLCCTRVLPYQTALMRWFSQTVDVKTTYFWMLSILWDEQMGFKWICRILGWLLFSVFFFNLCLLIAAVALR